MDMKSMINKDSDEIEEAREQRRGWCPSCEDFTTDDVDDDDFGQVCDENPEHYVLGVHSAILGEFLVPVLP